MASNPKNTEVEVPGLEIFKKLLAELAKLVGITATAGAAIGGAGATVLNRDGRESLGNAFGVLTDAFQRMWDYFEGRTRDVADELGTIYAVKWVVYPLWCIGWTTFVGQFNWMQWLGVIIPFLIISFWQATFLTRNVEYGAAGGFLWGMLQAVRKPTSIGDAFAVVTEMVAAGPKQAYEVLSRSVVKIWAEHFWWAFVCFYACVAPFGTLPKGMMFFPGLLAFMLVLANNACPWQNRDADGNLVRNAENKPQMPGAQAQMMPWMIGLLAVFPVVAWLRFDWPGPSVSVWQAVFGSSTLPGVLPSLTPDGNVQNHMLWAWQSTGAMHYSAVVILGLIGFVYAATRSSQAARIGSALMIMAAGLAVSYAIWLFWLIAPAVTLALIQPRRASARA